MILRPKNLPVFFAIVSWLVINFFNMAYADIEVMDDAGQQIILKKNAQRIISLAPFTTELLYEVGAGNKIIAVVQFSNYPKAAIHIPRVGSFNKIDLEAIIRLKPDLIVGWLSGTPKRQIKQLRKLGYTFYLAEPRSILDIASNLERLGKLVGNNKLASKKASDFRKRLRQLSHRYSKKSSIKVFYQIWDKPLMTVNGKHIISNIIRLCGGRNVFAELSTLAPRISIESVFAADPDVVITGGMGKRHPEWLEHWRKWPQLSAVKKNNLYFIHPDLLQRHSSRILQGTEQMCRLLEQARTKL